LVFNRSHGEHPISFGAVDWRELREFAKWESFMVKPWYNNRRYNWNALKLNGEIFQKGGYNIAARIKHQSGLPYITW
jgi:hypothetical protein